MAKRIKKASENNLLSSVIEGILSKKGLDVVSIDVRNLASGVCDYFVVCHGNSRTQVEALANSVEDTVRINTGQKPGHREGYQNAEWILLDYFDIVVHIFQPEVRQYFRIENVWGDGIIEKIN